MIGSTNFIDEHLNVNWLRPESALWDAIASTVISQFPFDPPSLDLGSGNGIFSFITAGGVFSPEYDWYRNVDPEGFWENRDIYDTFLLPPKPEWIVKKPSYRIDCALDHKDNLLRQVQPLAFYGKSVVADANLRLPFEEGAFQTIFSNILYWLDSPESSLQEIRRVLRPGGHALLCLQDHRFKEYCASYRWQELDSPILRLLNRGRSESHIWTTSQPELVEMAARLGFTVTSHGSYLSPLTLKTWDIGLRPLSPVLIRMVRNLNEADRLSVKLEWIEILRPFLEELYDVEQKSTEPGGYNFVCLQKV